MAAREAIFDRPPFRKHVSWSKVALNEKHCAARNAYVWWKGGIKTQNGALFGIMEKCAKT